MDGTEDARGGKTIILFSDGTGNSSAKLFKTNVWRLYEAVDLRVPEGDERPQIAYYDNGVGTSAFRPLALLGGIFGYGLKRNVQALYTFLCRNYEPGDRIYLFGFSRGAFTVRLLGGFIASQGVLRADSSTDLAYQVRDAYRAFCAANWPRSWIAKQVARGFRAVRDGALHLKRRFKRQKLYRDAPKLHPQIDFIGVWDTVAAYGGPFVELTRGIDDWVWPLTMPDYELSPKVNRARHALSLDDERDAFQPLLWDEHRESLLREHGKELLVTGPDGTTDTVLLKPEPGRIKQVWFAGVHSDVGGGYPDESLSYVPLLWMMEELGSDIRFLNHFVERAQSLANPMGPIHDSRAGVGAYYRYQPRKILALLHPPGNATLSLRDPAIHLPRRAPHGLLTGVTVHDSVLARTVAGIDGYAPSALPARFDIDFARDHLLRPSLSPSDLARFEAAEPHAKAREEAQENAWDLVWWRRLIYFATVAASLVLATLPLHGWLDSIDRLCSDDRCFAQDSFHLLLFFLPESIRDTLSNWGAKPIAFLLLALLILFLIARGQSAERRFRDRVRQGWSRYLAGQGNAVPPTTSWRRFREGKLYQHTLQLLKWRLLPTVFGWVTLLLIAFGFTVVASQTLYAIAEPAHVFCPRGGTAVPAGTARTFRTYEPCEDLAADLEAGRPYMIELTVQPASPSDPAWVDGEGLSRRPPASPDHGIGRADWLMAAFSPLKRVTGAYWMEPITIVRDGPAARSGFDPHVEIRRTNFTLVGGNRYVGTVCSRRSGRLYMAVNDAAPFLSDRFYRNNRGSASVAVTRLETWDRCPQSGETLLRIEGEKVTPLLPPNKPRGL